MEIEEKIKEIIETNNLIYLGKEKCKNLFEIWKIKEFEKFNKIFEETDEKTMNISLRLVYLEIKNDFDLNEIYLVLKFSITLEGGDIGQYNIFSDLTGKIIEEKFEIYEIL